MKPTIEQQKIIDTAKTGVNLAISAYAGAAKTTTCVMIANEIKHNSLYIAFNKSIADEAKEKFPSNVECRTLHSLAYEAIIKPSIKLRKKLGGFIDRKDILEILPELEKLPASQLPKVLANISELITKFCQSDKYEFGEFLESIDDTDNKELCQYEKLLVKVWGELVNQNTPYKITHDVYLKMFHLQKPNFKWFKTIYLDECQDSNPVTLDIVLKAAAAGSQVILVGDKYQSIYEWRGAINAFDNIPENFTKLSLTESFRFGSNIAELANVVIKNLGTSDVVVGRGNVTTVNSRAVLTRTNAGLFSYLVEAANQGKKVKVIGDLQDLFSAMYTANNIKFDGDRSKRFHKFIASFETWKELIDAAEHNLEVNKILNLINNYPQVHDSITMAKKAIFDPERDESYEYILCTGHKSKGLEFDYVTLADDFIPRGLEAEDFNFVEWLKQDQNGELLYVALTRAKVEVSFPDKLQQFLR